MVITFPIFPTGTQHYLHISECTSRIIPISCNDESSPYLPMFLCSHAATQTYRYPDHTKCIVTYNLAPEQGSYWSQKFGRGHDCGKPLRNSKSARWPPWAPVPTLVYFGLAPSRRPSLFPSRNCMSYINLKLSPVPASHKLQGSGADAGCSRSSRIGTL